MICAMDTTCEKCGKTISRRARANVWEGQCIVCTPCLGELKTAELRAANLAAMVGYSGRGWLIHDGRGQRGPYTTAQLIELLRAGRVKWEWQIWRDGMTKWVPIARLFTVPELSKGRIELRDFGQGDGTYRLGNTIQRWEHARAFRAR